jgi:class 3 adenylate cyclase
LQHRSFDLRELQLPPTISVVNTPQTSYAWNDGTALAYQVVGSSSGPDLLLVPGSVTHIEVLWQEPSVGRFLTRLAGFSRLILMDPRGLGLSDRLTDVPTLDERVADVIAVLDAAGSERSTLFGNADTGPPAIAAAISRPERVSSLILCGTYAKASRSDDYPMGWTDDEWSDFQRWVRDDWGNEAGTLRDVAPSRVDDDAFKRWWTTLMRLGASPRAVLLLGEMTMAVDVRDLLPRVSVPTLVMHRVGDRVNEIAHGRYLADRIPGARWVELPGEDFALWAGDLSTLADEVEEFLTGHRSGQEATKVVTTVMFTDIVASTERARTLGDSAWADLLEKHDALVRAELRRFGGQEVDTAGDGFLASFTSPTAAIRCARAVQEAAGRLRIQVRIGLHTGECDVIGGKPRGIAVHIGARVAAEADAGEVLISQTVKDLVAGSGLSLEDAGERELKGVPDRWRLYRVTGP